MAAAAPAPRAPWHAGCSHTHVLGLVLTAGGARGAYQAGVLRRIAEIPSLGDAPLPFPIVTGASAGAINGAALAARSARFAAAANDISRIWSELRVHQVVRSDALSLCRTGLALARDFVGGALFGHTVTSGLLDTAPLEELLRTVFPPRGIGDGIRQGHLFAVAITATSYHSGRSYTFVQGRPGHPVWSKSRRVVLAETLTHRHVLASSAIPIVFPPVAVRSKAGDLWFGDGALRLVAPLSPAIRLGASRILAVGIRSSRAADTLAREETGTAAPVDASGPHLPCPPLAQICGVFFNAIFLDHLDADVEHLGRMNALLEAEDGMSGQAESLPPGEHMRRIDTLLVSPSEDIAMIAQRFAHRMPLLVRAAMDGLGIPDAQSADLMSYLLFDAAYTRTLVDLGWRDADARIDEIEEFIRTAEPIAKPASFRSTRLRAVAGAPD